jgi:AcrR family transcriptional regulator
MSKPTTPTNPVVGRPRRFDDETERRMVMDAAMQVMARNGYARMSVDAVLSEAGLSTRAFYRHFESKEALLLGLMLRDAQSVGRSLERAVAHAPNPVAALEAWIDRSLDVYYEPKRAARTALFTSPAIRASYPLADATREMRHLFCPPLARALRAGHQTGALHSPTPEADAHTVFALVSAATDRTDTPFPDRSAAKAHIRRFLWPAFRLALED